MADIVSKKRKRQQVDLAGPGIGTYEQVDQQLPSNYQPLLGPKDTQKAISLIKSVVETGLCRELNLFRVECPLLVPKESGMNDMLDRDGSRTPVELAVGLGLEKRIPSQIVQAVTKWKRFALRQFECDIGEGIYTDMRAIRKDYFLDHDHSCYVDQWDWERVMTEENRSLEFLRQIVDGIWKVFVEADQAVRKHFPALNRYPPLPEKLTYIHAEEILDRYPGLPRKQRETAIAKEFQAVFIIGIGHTLVDGYPHELRAADYDDWITPTIKKDCGGAENVNRLMHGLNGDILVWNPVTNRRHELSSMGIRVTKDTLMQQLKEAKLEHYADLPYHQMILKDEVPLCVGGGIGQSRLYMLLLRKAALGECEVSVWPEALHNVCKKHNVPLLS